MLDETKLDVKLPTATVAALWGSAKEAEKDIRERVILSLFAEGQISAGKAAEILALAYTDFLDLLVRRRVPWPYGPDDLRQDVETLRRLDGR